MRVLIVGGTGMLGHKVWQEFRDRYETWVTVRNTRSALARFQLFDTDRLIEGVDAFNYDSLVDAIARVQPEVILNCIGIIKQLPIASDPIHSLTVNSLLPHRLAALAGAAGARLIHISTDCVFSGQRGQYTEADHSDALDLYGRSKFLGEVGGPMALTLRTSIIGRELQTSSGLVEWFLSQTGRRVRGFTRAFFSGITTLEMARLLAQVIDQAPGLSGLYHVASEPIAKSNLLELLREAYGLPTEIEPFSDMILDRSLDGRRLREATGYVAPSWVEMVQSLAQDPTPYAQWRVADES